MLLYVAKILKLSETTDLFYYFYHSARAARSLGGDFGQGIFGGGRARGAFSLFAVESIESGCLSSRSHGGMGTCALSFTGRERRKRPKAFPPLYVC